MSDYEYSPATKRYIRRLMTAGAAASEQECLKDELHRLAEEVGALGGRYVSFSGLFDMTSPDMDTAFGTQSENAQKLMGHLEDALFYTRRLMEELEEA